MFSAIEHLPKLFWYQQQSCLDIERTCRIEYRFNNNSITLLRMNVHGANFCAFAHFARKHNFMMHLSLHFCHPTTHSTLCTFAFICIQSSAVEARMSATQASRARTTVHNTN